MIVGPDVFGELGERTSGRLDAMVEGVRIAPFKQLTGKGKNAIKMHVNSVLI